MASNPISVEQIKEKINPILRKYPVKKAILFGSFAKGEANNTSDIDLYIDTNGELKGLDFVGLLEILVDTLGVNIDLIDKSHIDTNSLIIQEIEDEGIVIYEKSKDHDKTALSWFINDIRKGRFPQPVRIGLVYQKLEQGIRNF